MKLVTLEQAKLRLRIDDGLDADVDLMIAGASLAIVRYLDAAADFLDEDGKVPVNEAGDPVGVPEDVQNATLYLVGSMLRDPDGKDAAQWDMAYLPRPVIGILASRRKPALA